MDIVPARSFGLLTRMLVVDSLPGNIFFRLGCVAYACSSTVLYKRARYICISFHCPVSA